MLLCWLLIGLGAAALALGFLQMAQGPQSALRFYDITNSSEAVGFFANRNHFAAHLYVTLVLASVWFALTAAAPAGPLAFKTRGIFWFTAAALFLVAIVAGLAMARSRAGVGLAMAALAGVVLMIYGQRRPGHAGGENRRRSSARISVAAVIFALVFAAQFGLGGILSRFEADPLEDLRIPLARTTFETALKVLPFGAGLGSFVPVYGIVEKSADAFDGYANRAHNDLAELLLETGFPGAFLLCAFLVWFVRRSYSAWRKPAAGTWNEAGLLERASTLIVFLLLAHSLVDYPLRTTALSVVFVFACAILAMPAVPAAEESPQTRRRTSTSRWQGGRRAPAEVWGDGDLNWPDVWQRKGSEGEGSSHK